MTTHTHTDTLNIHSIITFNSFETPVVLDLFHTACISSTYYYEKLAVLLY